MKVTKKQAALATILYADIFDYPLSVSELRLWCVLQNTSTIPALPEIKMRDNFFFLSGRSPIVSYRRHRQQWAKEKWAIARRASQLLRLVPSMELIGVTGGLAMENAKKEDDIDLFFIVAPGTIWISRLLAIVVMEVCGMRRRPRARDVKNAICLNMFMTADALALKERDLYTAHEVLQMQPLWERGKIYQKFLQENIWVKKFLPTAWRMRSSRSTSGDVVQISSILRLFELPAKFMQLWYMRHHRTTEIISDRVLRFHPKDARGWVKEAFAKRLARHNLPLDKIFYGR